MRTPPWIRTTQQLGACLLSLVLLACADQKTAETVAPYEIIHREVLQPLDHAVPGGAVVHQQVDILVPDGVPPDSPVFFDLGNESDLTDETLIELHHLHGDGIPVIYVQAEHRGYGQSLSDYDDQTVPSYVSIEQALADAHEVVTLLKGEYPGPWMAAGWSYGGGLVIDFAHRYPDDVEVVLSSSGVVDWPHLNYAYDERVRTTLGDSCYQRMVGHSENLEPAELFDRNWMEREFLHAIVKGMTQREDVRHALPYLKLASFLPTRVFLAVLHRIDAAFGDGEAWRYAVALSKKKLTRQEAASGSFGWRVWRYQQCMQTGVFFASRQPGGLFARTREDIRAESLALFGEEPRYASAPEWSPRSMLGDLTVPLVYVSGGEDPWLALGISPDERTARVRRFHVATGRHCPDRDDPALARAVLSEMVSIATARRSRNASPVD